MTTLTPQFITVQATFRPSILNLPLALLPALPEPVQALSLSARKELVSDKDPYENEAKGAKPVKEVWTMLEYLMAAAPCPDIWTQDIDALAVLDVLNSVDAGKPLPSDTTTATVVASCLKLVLSWVPDSLLGKQKIGCEKVKSRDDAFAAIEGLNQVNTNVSRRRVFHGEC